MHVLLQTLGSSIGKKLLMAVTGFCFCGFLVVHLAGNLSVYGGETFFESYVAHLHSLGVLINVAEIGLLTLALVHVTTGVILFIGNLRARPVPYAVARRSGGRTWGSATMPYTGFFILAFVVYHLIGFHFADHSTRTVFQIMTDAFAVPGTAVLYTAAALLVALHVSHGFWSLFQTFGANHPAYLPVVEKIGLGFAVVLAAGFGSIPVYLWLW
ncbi:MAG: succinate dehydrogenase cytochrome b subunit [Thermodesulfobacteriota bacterium]